MTTINHLLKRLTAWLEGFMGQDTAPMLPIAPGAALGDVLTLKWDADDERKERELYLANPLAFWLRPDRHEHGAMCWAVEGVWREPEQKRNGQVVHLLPSERVRDNFCMMIDHEGRVYWDRLDPPTQGGSGRKWTDDDERLQAERSFWQMAGERASTQQTADEALFRAIRRSAASDVKFKPLSISFPID